jgi:hypothetical protein
MRILLPRSDPIHPSTSTGVDSFVNWSVRRFSASRDRPRSPERAVRLSVIAARLAACVNTECTKRRAGGLSIASDSGRCIGSQGVRVVDFIFLRRPSARSRCRSGFRLIWSANLVAAARRRNLDPAEIIAHKWGGAQQQHRLKLALMASRVESEKLTAYSGCG